jgi:hypothetical protein
VIQQKIELRQDTGVVERGNMAIVYKITNSLTNGNVIKTAKIAAAHLTERPNYYTLLQKYVERKK